MADDRTCLFNGPSRFLIGSNGDWEDDRRAVASERLEDHLVQWHFFCLLLHRSTGLIRHLPFYHGRKFQYSSGLGGIHFWFESDSPGRPRGNSNRHRLAKQIVAMVCCIGHFGRCSINCWNWLGQFPDHLRLSVHIWSLLCNTEHSQFCLVLWFYPTGFPSEVVVTSEHRESARLRRWSILQPFSVCILWKWMATCLKFLAYGVHPAYPVDTTGSFSCSLGVVIDMFLQIICIRLLVSMNCSGNLFDLQNSTVSRSETSTLFCVAMVHLT